MAEGLLTVLISVTYNNQLPLASVSNLDKFKLNTIIEYVAEFSGKTKFKLLGFWGV